MHLKNIIIKITMNDKIKLLDTIKRLNYVLKTIENLLENYSGIDGNINYIKYCRNKAREANELNVPKILDTAYNIDLSKRENIDVELLYDIAKKQFKLLDDIDTASDVFKPKWCSISSAVSEMQGLRWLYCSVKYNPDDSNDLMVINGYPYTKDNRVVLTF